MNHRQSRGLDRARSGWFLLLAVVLAACASPGLMKDIVRDEPAYAPPPAVTGVLAGLAAGITAAHDEDHSGFHLLDTGRDGLW